MRLVAREPDLVVAREPDLDRREHRDVLAAIERRDNWRRRSAR